MGPSIQRREIVENRGIDSENAPEQTHLALAAWDFARRLIFLIGRVRAVARGSGAFLVLALEDFGVGVAELDGNISLQLVLESDGHDA